MRRLLLATLAFTALLPLGAESKSSDPNAAVRRALQAELEDFSQPDWSRWFYFLPSPPAQSPFVPEAGPAVEDYRQHLVRVAPWGTGPVWHQMGSLPVALKSGTVRLGLNVFRPPGESKGTLVFVHGYLSHAANFAYTSAYFVARGWVVVTLDLPGHGLSEGARGDVTDWSDYGDAVSRVLEWTRAQGWPGPSALMAHSLGTAASLEALRRPGSPKPDHVVFCAPLLRPDWFGALAVGEAALGWAIRDFPSSFGWDGYLDGYVMPVNWFRQLAAWLPKLEKQEPLKLPLTIYSGDRDDVVDERWNLEAYRRLVPGAPVVWLPGRGHLFLTGNETREEFHRLLGETVAAWEPW